MSRFHRLAATVSLLAFGLPAWAQALVDGEVRKLDLEQAKVTLKHAEIKALDMPAMTMVFSVRDKASLAALKVGDKVRFKPVQEGGRYVITEIQVVR